MIKMTPWDGMKLLEDERSENIKRLIDSLKEGDSQYGYSLCGDTIIVAFWDKYLNGTGGFEIFDCKIRKYGEFPFPAQLMKDNPK
jgi:hypothetical protein